MHRAHLLSSLGLTIEHQPETHPPNASPPRRDLSCHADEYRPDLSTGALIAEIRALLDRQRVLERLMCRYLADLADRIAERREVDPFGGYLDVYEAADHVLGLDVRRTRERVRVGRALRSLPQIEQAFERGTISYTRVREITRIARPESEALWLELGTTLPVRRLERRVIAAGQHALEKEFEKEAGLGRAVTPASHPSEEEGALNLGSDASTVALVPHSLEGARAGTTQPDPSGKVRLVFDVTVDGWLIVQEALRAVRNHTSATLTDAEALIALARETMPFRREPLDSGDEAAPAVFDNLTRDEVNPAGLRDVMRDRATPAGLRDIAVDALTAAGSRDVAGDALIRAGLRDVADASIPAGSRDVAIQASTPAGLRGVVGHASTPAGSREVVREALTPAGSREGVCDESEQRAGHAAMMISRRRWNADELHEATGLSIPAILVALTRLELEAMIRRDLVGYSLTYAA